MAVSQARRIKHLWHPSSLGSRKDDLYSSAFQHYQELGPFSKMLMLNKLLCGRNGRVDHVVYDTHTLTNSNLVTLFNQLLAYKSYFILKS